VALTRVDIPFAASAPTIVFESAGRFTLVESGDVAKFPAGGYAVVPL